MPARAPARSQRATQASQNQLRAGRSQRPAPAEEEDDEEADEEEDEEDAPMDGEVPRGTQNDALVRKANDLVRLALFTEQKRVPLKRADITDKVLGKEKLSFKAVFDMAQKILSQTFGMELVELRSRAEIHAEGEEGNKDGELEEARKSTGVKKKAAVAGSKTYILRSTLDPIIIEHAALTDAMIYEEEIADGLDDDDDDDRVYGSIISWSHGDQLGAIGILYVVLTLILVSGRVITEMDLRGNLKRLRLPPSAFVSFNARSTHKQMTIDAFLSQIARQGYVERTKIGDHGKAAGVKRGRAPAATQANSDENATYEWRWGNRAYSEVGEKAIAAFAGEFMVERMDNDGGEEDEGQRGNAARKKKEEARRKALDKMVKGIERAAGGNLSEIK